MSNEEEERRARRVRVRYRRTGGDKNGRKAVKN